MRGKQVANSTILRIIFLAFWILLAFIPSGPPLLAQSDTTDITADEVKHRCPAAVVAPLRRQAAAG